MESESVKTFGRPPNRHTPLGAGPFALMRPSLPAMPDAKGRISAVPAPTLRGTWRIFRHRCGEWGGVLERKRFN